MNQILSRPVEPLIDVRHNYYPGRMLGKSLASNLVYHGKQIIHDGVPRYGIYGSLDNLTSFVAKWFELNPQFYETDMAFKPSKKVSENISFLGFQTPLKKKIKTLREVLDENCFHLSNHKGFNIYSKCNNADEFVDRYIVKKWFDQKEGYDIPFFK